MRFQKTTKHFLIVFLIAIANVTLFNKTALAATQGFWPNTTAPADIVVANSSANENMQYITQTSDNDYIVAYGLTGRAFAQKFSSADGSALPGWNGGSPSMAIFYLPVGIAPDASGGAYIATNIDFGGGSCGIFVQRLDASGTAQFAPGGINVTAGSGGCEAFMQMIPDGSGGFYLAWGNGGPNTNTFQTLDLFITRVNSSGVVDPGWNTGGAGTFRPVQFPETAAGTSFEHSAKIINDGAGNVVAMYESDSTSYNFVASKFAANGAIAGAPWNGPLNLDPDNNTPTGNNGSLGHSIIADGSGGVIIGYLIGPAAFPNGVEAQRVNAAGTLQWGSGITVSTTDIANGSWTPVIVGDGTGGVILAWNTKTVWDVWAHHVTSSGTLDATGSWGGAPIALTDTTDGNSDWIINTGGSTGESDGAGGAYILTASYDGGGYPVSKLQHLKSDGTLEFTGEGIPLASGGPGITGVESVMISDGGTGVVTVYRDSSPTTFEDIYMQHFDDLVATPSGGGGTRESCTIFPPKLDLPNELNVIHQEGRPVVKLKWGKVHMRDTSAADKIHVFFDYLNQSPYPRLDSTGKDLEGVFTRHMYQRIYHSGDDQLIHRFEHYLKTITDRQNDSVLQILNSQGIGYHNDYFSDWWPYIFINEIKNNQPAADILITSVSKAIKSKPFSYKALISDILRNFYIIKKSPQALEAAQCIGKAVNKLSLDDFVPGQGNNVYGSYDKPLEDLLIKMKEGGNIKNTLNALKQNPDFLNGTVNSLKGGINALFFNWAHDSIVRNIISFYQGDNTFQKFKETLFKTEIVQKMEDCLKATYKRNLMTSVNDARFKIVQKAIKQSEVCEEDVSDTLIEVIKELVQDPDTKYATEEIILQFINELLNIEKYLSGNTSYKNSFSDYFDIHYKPASENMHDDLTLKIYRDGKLIHMAENPIFTSYDDETPPVNSTDRIKAHRYYLLTQTACESKIGSAGTAYIDPQLVPGTAINVDADIKIKIKKGYDLLFTEKLHALIQAAKTKNPIDKITGQNAPESETNNTLGCAEAGINLNTADLNSDNVMNYILACHGSPELSSKLQERRLKIIPPLLIILKLSAEKNSTIIDNYIRSVIKEMNEEIARTKEIFKLAGESLAELDAAKGISEFNTAEKELIQCAGIPNCPQAVKDKITSYFKDSSHSADLNIELYDESGEQVYQTNAKTDIFGEANDVTLGQFLSGQEYTIKIFLKDQHFVLPKVSRVTLNTAEPKAGDSFKTHINLNYDHQFRYGNFDESNDIIDTNDILAWGKLISEQPGFWNDSNLDGLYGVDLLDAITFQQNWGEIREARLEENQITLMELARLFGLVTSQQTKVPVPDWLSYLEQSCR